MADKNSQCMSVRLLISKKNGKIVYAEARKDFVELLLSFLTMPLGSVMKLLSASGSSKKGTHSISTIPDETCVCGLALNYPVEFSSNSCQSNIQVTDGGSSNGYVKGTVTFMITDDLNITPSSTITCIKLLNQLNARDLSDLEEKTVSVGTEEALELLWASLVSTTPLNDVFSTLVGKTGKD
ncbi:hypothetical protein SUGI_0730470 [Cryptomeria japonica]|nr:hypothetical protein SUGI_0730470 [Cryptomeria japonica]